jgi:hypothetical protein
MNDQHKCGNGTIEMLKGRPLLVRKCRSGREECWMLPYHATMEA